MNKEMIKVWGWTLFSVSVLWGLSNILTGVASKTFDTNPIIYVSCMFLGSSFSLLLYAGNGPLGKETMRSIDSWAYGFILMISFSMSYFLIQHTTASEGAFFQRFSVVICTLSSWIFLGRKVSKQSFIGMLLVVLGTIIMCSGVANSEKFIVYSLIILFGFMQAVRIIVAEIHKTHNYASQQANKKERVRVVGYVMFIVSLIFLFGTLIFSLLDFYTGGNNLSILPALDDFKNPYSIFLGLFAGILIMAPIRLIEFSAANKIKAENYLALGTLAPFSTLFWEWATSPITGLSLKEFTQNDLIAGLIILAGGLVIAFSKAKKQIDNDINEYVYQTVTDVEIIEDSKDIIQKTMTYFNKDINEVAKVLNLPIEVARAVLEQGDIALKKDVLKRVERVYRIDISSKDSLTGLLNRSGLMQRLELLINRKKDFTLFYIDLNKFKPINDTYGHQAGDEALQVVAKRLSEFHKNVKIVSRLGGDEYVIVLEKDLNIVDFTQSLHNKIEEFFTLESVNMVASLSASIGHVKYVDYKQMNAEELLEFADKMMLDLKESAVR